MISTNMEPIRVIEREGFLQFINVAVPGYKLPSRDDFREVAARVSISAEDQNIIVLGVSGVRLYRTRRVDVAFYHGFPGCRSNIRGQRLRG
ncbi:hypothetical protein MRX96_009211 [Rhipicephalus microplus]